MSGKLKKRHFEKWENNGWTYFETAAKKSKENSNGPREKKVFQSRWHRVPERKIWVQKEAFDFLI